MNNWKIPCSEIFVSLRGPTIWRVMPRNVCNDSVCWQTRRLNNSTKYQLHALITIISKKKKWNLWENCQKYALKLFGNALLGTTGRPDILWSVNKTCTTYHKMDQSLWQTIISFDLLHSSHMWIRTIWSCGKHCTAMKIGIVSRLRFCRMIIKGRSPTMRHVSRTHSVALDWLFDRINLDPKIQIKYIDTKNQLADILTKGNFTRDKWNHLLCLFNISHFSSTNCSEVMSRRMQKDAVKKESQQNRSRWWIWSRDAATGILTCLLHQKGWGKTDMKVNYLWARGMSST